MIKRNRQHLTLRLPREEKAKLREWASDDGVSRSEFVRRLITREAMRRMRVAA